MFKWPWSKKKKKANESQEVDRCVMHNRLTITMLDGKNLEWNQTKGTGKNYLVPLINFYQWYFEKDTPYYVMKYARGETMFKRADIKTFTVHT